MAGSGPALTISPDPFSHQTVVPFFFIGPLIAFCVSFSRPLIKSIKPRRFPQLTQFKFNQRYLYRNTTANPQIDMPYMMASAVTALVSLTRNPTSSNPSYNLGRPSGLNIQSGLPAKPSGAPPVRTRRANRAQKTLALRRLGFPGLCATGGVRTAPGSRHVSPPEEAESQ